MSKRDKHWVMVSTSFMRHKKLAHLSRELDIPRYAAHGLVVGLWELGYTTEDFADIEPEDLARELYWDGNSAVLYNKFIQCGFLDQCQDGSLRIHNWEYYSGVKQKKEKALDRKSQRERQIDQTKDTVASQSDSVGNTSDNGENDSVTQSSDIVALPNDNVAQIEEIEEIEKKRKENAKKYGFYVKNEHGMPSWDDFTALPIEEFKALQETDGEQCQEDYCFGIVQTGMSRCDPHELLERAGSPEKKS